MYSLPEIWWQPIKMQSAINVVTTTYLYLNKPLSSSCSGLAQCNNGFLDALNWHSGCKHNGGYFKKQNKGTQPLRAFIRGMKVCACCAFNKGLIRKSQCCTFMFTCHALQPINYVVFSVLMYLLFISNALSAVFCIPRHMYSCISTMCHEYYVQLRSYVGIPIQCPFISLNWPTHIKRNYYKWPSISSGTCILHG